MKLNSVRDDEAFYAHFPKLRTLLRDSIQGRNAKVLSGFVNDDSFMNNWNVSMRYSDGKEISSSWVDAWANQAGRAVAAMET